MENSCTHCGPVCLKDEIRAHLYDRHALFVQSLGICSAIALTGYIGTTLVIGLIIILVAVLSTLIISVLRNLILRRARFLVQVTVITTLVIAVHLLLRTYWTEMREALGPYLGLVITNCLIMDSAERTGMHRPVLDAVRIVLARSLGYSLILVATALVREPLGHGSLLGVKFLPDGWEPLALVGAAPGAFFVLGIIWWAMKARTLHLHKTRTAHE